MVLSLSLHHLVTHSILSCVCLTLVAFSYYSASFALCLFCVHSIPREMEEAIRLSDAVVPECSLRGGNLSDAKQCSFVWFIQGHRTKYPSISHLVDSMVALLWGGNVTCRDGLLCCEETYWMHIHFSMQREYKRTRCPQCILHMLIYYLPMLAVLPKRLYMSTVYKMDSRMYRWCRCTLISMLELKKMSANGLLSACWTETTKDF